MREGEAQGAIAAHRDAANGASRTAGKNPILAFHLRNEFLQKEVAVRHGAIGRVDIERAAPLWSDDQEITHLALVAQIVEQRPAAAIEEGLLVVAEAVQKIEHRVAPCRMLRRTCIVAGWQVYAI